MDCDIILYDTFLKSSIFNKGPLIFLSTINGIQFKKLLFLFVLNTFSLNCLLFFQGHLDVLHLLIPKLFGINDLKKSSFMFPASNKKGESVNICLDKSESNI